MFWNTKQFEYRICELAYLPTPSPLLWLAYHVMMSHLEACEAGLCLLTKQQNLRHVGPVLGVGHDQTQLL